MYQFLTRQARLKPREAAKAYLFLLPMLVFAVMFVYYPFLRTIRYSLSLVDERGRILGFEGFANFQYLFSKRFGFVDGKRVYFIDILLNTVRFTLMNVPITVLITLVAARLCLRRRKISFALESMFALPMAVAMTAATLIFRVMLNPTVGIVNQALGLKIQWFESGSSATYALLSLTVWMGIGFNFLLFLSALSGISDDVVDSARLDGAGPLCTFLLIQIPLLRPTLLYVVCTNAVQAMLTSGPIMVLFNGSHKTAPVTTLIYTMYTSGYASRDYSVAACISIITFALTLLFTVVMFVFDLKRGEQD